MSGKGTSVFIKGLFCRCPRCGQGKIFKGFLKLEGACESCHLNLKNAENGDGAAFFVISIVGFVTASLAWILEETASPSLWVHYFIWFPFIIVMSLLLLRPAKSMLISYQYYYQPHLFEGD